MSSYLKLDSSDNTYVTISSSFPDVGSFNATFAIWCRFTSTSVSKVLLHRYDGLEGYKVTFNEETNGDLSLEFFTQTNGGSLTSRIENVPVKLDEWQLFVFVIDRLSSQSIYIDAIQHADTFFDDSTPALAMSPAVPLYLGYDPDNPSSSSVGNIDIDGFYFFDKPSLTESQIRSLYNKGRGAKMVGDEPQLASAFNFDEGTGSTVTDVVASVTGTITSDVSPFDNVWGGTGGVAVMLPSDIKMYLTSLEPYIAQTNYSQSIGGYISTSLLYPFTTLASPLGLYGTSITLDDATDLIGYDYVSIVKEIIKVEEIASVNVVATERGVNGTIGYYPSDTIIQGVVSPFNDSFDTDRKQYRCYAVKNTSLAESAYNVSAYFRQLSANENTTMRLALEVPKSQGITGTSTSWTSSMLVDSSLAGVYEDNLFSDSYMEMLSGPNVPQKRRINSYDGSTGAFVFADSLPVDYDPLLGHSSSVSYTVDVSPAQRVKSGVDTPADTDFITDFSEALNRDAPVELNLLIPEGMISPEEIVYIWVEREIGKSNTSYDENSFVLNIDFDKELEGN